ncbi:hypothetical protein SHTP_2609 [Mycobacterium ulcerans subsp. shinshuense]|uniref:Uncharacterized protein n=3 Tax=Mycobacterium ulcerans group TaxID=2993898 RepID=A0A1B4Y3T0_MYCUL|nr:hypothetical protein SHTP_2609 [Mycobacterium ulcerans subsp. shinshuense]
MSHPISSCCPRKVFLTRYCLGMTVAADRHTADKGFAIEDMLTGIFASGYGQVGDGHSFSFRIEHRSLVVEIYRPRLTGPVPQAEDVVARSVRGLVDIDLTDERSLAAAVRDSVTHALPASH